MKGKSGFQSIGSKPSATEKRRVNRTRVLSRLEETERSRKTEFVRILDTSQLPLEIRADSYLWCDRFFTPHANPYSPSLTVQRGIHIGALDTSDLLVHLYRVFDFDIEVIESRDFTFVRTAWPRDIRSLARKLLGPGWKFPIPAVPEEGSFFHAPPIYNTRWTARADGGIRDGGLYLYCPKDSAISMEDRPWFDPEFRSRVCPDSP